MIVLELEHRPQRSGQVRTRYLFTFDDGREFHRPINAESEAMLPQAIVLAQAQCINFVMKVDALDAVVSGIKTAHKTASANQVQYAWMQAAFNEEDPIAAYEIMSEVAPALVSLGYTAAQYAAIFGGSEAEVQRLLDRWEYLSNNAAELGAFKTVREGDL
ncbi:MAG: hypothetical protein COB36_10620 [Alphaproteobacteria bacterium]|nr:MAG: hypothetical protein COB36_10620 [Alphaproteobacteria bacterium]